MVTNNKFYLIALLSVVFLFCLIFISLMALVTPVQNTKQ